MSVGKTTFFCVGGRKLEYLLYHLNDITRIREVSVQKKKEKDKMSGSVIFSNKTVCHYDASNNQSFIQILDITKVPQNCLQTLPHSIKVRIILTTNQWIIFHCKCCFICIIQKC